MQPKTKYAKSGDVHIAYQVFGEGPVDLVFVAGSGIAFEDYGTHELKGVPDLWQLFRAIG